MQGGKHPFILPAGSVSHYGAFGRMAEYTWAPEEIELKVPGVRFSRPKGKVRSLDAPGTRRGHSGCGDQDALIRAGRTRLRGQGHACRLNCHGKAAGCHSVPDDHELLFRQLSTTAQGIDVRRRSTFRKKHLA